MLDPGQSGTLDELIAGARADAEPFADTVDHLGADHPSVEAAIELGLPFSSGAAADPGSLKELRTYRDLVDFAGGSGWMDNTTIVTAAALMSEAGFEAMTPLTVWDLVTFTRAVVSYEHIYHHVHPAVDDAEINRRLGDEVLKPIPLPEEPADARSPLPEPWDGPHRLLCEVWFEAKGWVQRLAESADTPTLDGHQLAAVRDSWRKALARPDLQVDDLVDWHRTGTRWTSPSDQLLRQIADATDIKSTYMQIDPTPLYRKLNRLRAEAGGSPGRDLSDLLTDLNLRAYVNQRLADFFGLPYVCGAARVPFRRHLYDRAVAVQHRLTALDVIDDRYTEVAGEVSLRLPVFLAIAVREAGVPDDVWDALARLRQDAKAYRDERAELDEALARGDRKVAKKIGKALTMSVDNVLVVAGKAVANGSVAVVEQLAKGDPIGIAAGVAGVTAAGQGLLDSSVVDRLIWRLRRPHFLWINNVMDEAERLTEALPSIESIWRVPEKEHASFITRFQTMGALQSGS